MVTGRGADEEEEETEEEEEEELTIESQGFFAIDDGEAWGVSVVLLITELSHWSEETMCERSEQVRLEGR